VSRKDVAAPAVSHKNVATPAAVQKDYHHKGTNCAAVEECKLQYLIQHYSIQHYPIEHYYGRSEGILRRQAWPC
jgi:hypothetical protein